MTPIVSEPNTGQPSAAELEQQQTAPDQQQTSLVTSLVSDQSGQILVENPADLNSPAAVQPISEADVNSPNCSPASQQNEALDMPPAENNEPQPPNKPTENAKLSSDSDKLNSSSNQEILNAISTSSTTNELITTTCTNVTLLTANWSRSVNRNSSSAESEVHSSSNVVGYNWIQSN